MAYRDSYGGFGGVSVTPWVKRLLIANTAVFLALFIMDLIPATRGFTPLYLAFRPRSFITQPWTLVTYSFVHAGIWHLLGNMLTLFFFGPPLEERWGGRGFLKYYAVAVLGGALLSAALYPVDPAAAIVGASAGTLGLMLAFAMIWPDMLIHIWGIFPVKAKWLVAGLAVINLMMAVSPGSNGTAVLAHLGGMAAGFLLLKSPWAPPAWGEMASVVSRGQPVRRGGALVPWTPRKAEAPRAPAGTATQARPAATGRKKAASAERELLDDVDRILDKISSQGLASLTEDERQRLDEVSRRYRTN
ncbi:rhomboid family protein [Longimicrobium terrae]|uniref:Membrane associated rhomboid family serine protease n=1 Tax=Longimicrobium terrae TaxID=1639882 RepID=A0A841H545_9BACT|nr:rhomboid family intramembrane serine protease [Longimicrobium terrae]MBB4638649.1 membrane associated rhomboid family serine protease [Longimicrobium terrae]MBB6072889.1 membrane associated rhomboid family serine protease [Longimicrobium terrae]NNC31502.1 rhomboid family intramembrane serine protease [Longimicrobium terrae]